MKQERQKKWRWKGNWKGEESRKAVRNGVTGQSQGKAPLSLQTPMVRGGVCVHLKD